jgi:hypothetical protein
MSEEIVKKATQPIGKENPPILGVKQYEAGLQLMQQFIKKVTVTVKKNKVDVTYHWELPNEEMAKAVAQGIKQQYEG